MSEYIPAGVAAKMLGVTTVTLGRWVEQDRLSCVITDGGRRRYHRGEVRALAGEMRWRAIAFNSFARIEQLREAIRLMDAAMVDVREALPPAEPARERDPSVHR